MAKIKLELITLNGKINSQTKLECKKKVVVCDCCNGIIAAPPNSVVYKHCYNCGAEFAELVSARSIRELKHQKVEI